MTPPPWLVEHERRAVGPSHENRVPRLNDAPTNFQLIHFLADHIDHDSENGRHVTDAHDGQDDAHAPFEPAVVADVIAGIHQERPGHPKHRVPRLTFQATRDTLRVTFQQRSQRDEHAAAENLECGDCDEHDDLVRSPRDPLVRAIAQVLLPRHGFGLGVGLPHWKHHG